MDDWQGTLTLEVGGVRNKVGASSWAAVAAEGSTGPVTTKGGVDDNVVVVEACSSVARIVVGEVRSRLAPGRGVGVAVGDVRRDRAACEEPDHDTLAIPFVCKDASRLLVEARAEGVVSLLRNCAASVGAI